MTEAEIDYALTGHIPYVAPTINLGAPRHPKELIERFRSAYIPVLADAVGPLYTMDSSIRPLYMPTPRLLGQALTVKSVPGDNLTVHGALTMAQPNDVLVIDWRGYSEACGCGSGSIANVMSKGLVGAVVDGAWRDIGELRSFGFPVFGKAISPLSPPKRRPGEINVPVHCGGVVVSPGDVIVGDEEGIVVIPSMSVVRVAETLRQYEQKTNVEEWQPDRFDERVERRYENFVRIVNEYGGNIGDASL